MVNLTKVKISARKDNSSKMLNRFTKMNLVQDIYGLSSFEIYYRLDMIEKVDEFPIKNSTDLIGESITVSSISVNKKEEKTIKNYKMVIVQISSRKHSVSNRDEIVVHGYSPEWFLNGRKKNRAFINNSLGEIVQKIMKPYPKPLFDIDSKPEYKKKIPYTVQYMETDLEFLRRLANRYGEWFYNNGSTICFSKLPGATSELTLGISLNKFEYDIKMNAFSDESLAYNSSSGKNIKTEYKSDEIKGKVDIYHKKVIDKAKKKFINEGNIEVAYMPLEEENAETILKSSKELKGNANIVNMATITAESILPDIEIGQKLKISGFDKDKNKFSYGEYIVERIEHYFDENYGYNNKMILQSSKIAFSRSTDPELIPVCHDLKKARVTDIEDPDKLGRIKVKFPWMNKDGETESPWIQVSRPYISEKGGIFFLPEIGSEVLVGFESGNMERPYVYGSLYSKGTYKPDNAWKKENYYLRSASGHTIHFADESGNQNITIYDSEKYNKIILSVSDKKLTIESEGDILVKSQGDMQIKATGDLKMDSSQKIIMTGKSGVEINSNSEVGIKADAGISGDTKGNMQLSGATFKAEGKGTAEISSSGITTVKGSMVKIN